MGEFSESLVTRYIKKGIRKVYIPFTYTPSEHLGFKPVSVPKDFLTDFASVPWPASMLIPKDGDSNQAAVVHDYLYTTKDRPRSEADKIFLDGMETLKVNIIKRRIMYQAVRIGGWAPWKLKKS